MPLCAYCTAAPAVLKRPKTGDAICKSCFLSRFEEEVHSTIVSQRLFHPGERVAIAASGGKDSTVLACVLSKLNRERGYGLDLFLLSVDEGISGYRDDSLESVRRNREEYGVELFIVSYRDLYGWAMDDIVREVGRKNNCTFCGVFRRQALDRGAIKMKAEKIVTGHNADDLAETVLMNRTHHTRQSHVPPTPHLRSSNHSLPLCLSSPPRRHRSSRPQCADQYRRGLSTAPCEAVQVRL
jgi:cytoplasmic tRNA 2-thiolation protein 1